MLYNEAKMKFGSYGCHFLEYPVNAPVFLHSVGHLHIDAHPFIWNGLKRGQNRTFLFQYTISGLGMLRIDGQVYAINPGQAFLVEIPGDHEYYMPEGTDHWQFIFITLQGGDHVRDCWSFVRHAMGNAPVMEMSSSVICHLFRIFQDVGKQRITDGYQAVGLAYQFLTELYREAAIKQAHTEHWPVSVVEAVRIIEQDFHKIEGLEDLSQQTAVSKYHLARLFRQHVGMTAVQYLTKTRMKKAVVLLIESNYTIERIADLVGYHDGKYFTKIFKHFTGLSPRQYSRNYDMVTVDHLFNE